MIVTQSCPTLWDCIDCSPPDSSVHGIPKTRILEWGIAISFSRKFTKEGTQMANKHTKRHSTSFVNGEIQIKSTVKYHYMSTRLTNLKRINISNILNWNSLSVDELKMSNLPWKTVQQYFLKLSLYIPCNPVLPLLNQQKCRHVCTKWHLPDIHSSIICGSTFQSKINKLLLPTTTGIISQS